MSDSTKFDPLLRQLLGRLAAESSRDDPLGARTVSVFVRGSARFTTDQIDELVSSGARIRTVSGDIISADVPAARLDDIANHTFVTEVALSGPLFSESG